MNKNPRFSGNNSGTIQQKKPRIQKSEWELLSSLPFRQYGYPKILLLPG